MSLSAQEWEEMYDATRKRLAALIVAARPFVMAKRKFRCGGVSIHDVDVRVIVTEAQILDLERAVHEGGG